MPCGCGSPVHLPGGTLRLASRWLGQRTAPLSCPLGQGGGAAGSAGWAALGHPAPVTLASDDSPRVCTNGHGPCCVAILACAISMRRVSVSSEVLTPTARRPHPPGTASGRVPDTAMPACSPLAALLQNVSPGGSDRPPRSPLRAKRSAPIEIKQLQQEAPETAEKQALIEK